MEFYGNNKEEKVFMIENNSGNKSKEALMANAIQKTVKKAAKLVGETSISYKNQGIHTVKGR